MQSSDRIRTNASPINALRNYLALFERPAPEDARFLDQEMQAFLRSAGYCDLWEAYLDTNEQIKRTDIGHADSFAPVVMASDLNTLRAWVCFAHRQITHWQEAGLLQYRDFFICILRRMIELEGAAATPGASVPASDCNALIARAERAYETERAKPHGRYRSWEHCYTYFQKNRGRMGEETRDTACLHLAWYLASWGMLRNSFLMQYDHLAHRNAVDFLFSDSCAPLYAPTVRQLWDESFLCGMVDRVAQLRQIYQCYASQCNAGVSDTLMTKVLLGTTGCTPAYDRYFCKGLIITGIAKQKFGLDSLRSIGRYLKENEAALAAFAQRMGGDSCAPYPPMKVLDMCLWQAGYDAETQGNGQGERAC